MSISTLPLRIRSFGFPLLLATLGFASAPLLGQAPVQETTPKPPPVPKAPKKHTSTAKTKPPKEGEKEPAPPKKHAYQKKHTGTGGNPSPKKAPPHEAAHVIQRRQNPPATDSGVPK
jgi:hypothetical protein